MSESAQGHKKNELLASYALYKEEAAAYATE
jgi:hypothetical protein